MRIAAQRLGLAFVLLSISGQVSEAADCHALIRQPVADDMNMFGKRAKNWQSTLSERDLTVGSTARTGEAVCHAM